MQLLRKENDPLNSLIGRSFNQKSKFQAEKILNEIHSRAQSRTVSKSALCYILDKDEIKGVGGSTLMKTKDGKIISNLILDQFGVLFAGVLSKFQVADKIIQLKSTTGGLINLKAIGSGTTFPQLGFGGIGNRFQVGAGVTAPARTDFNIETAFGTAPESGLMAPATDPVFNSGLGNFKMNASITAGGAGTINESVWIGTFLNTANATNNYAFFRDIITPAQVFIASETIALEYTVQL